MTHKIFAVARAILQKTGPIPVQKLQTLLFYTQAWSLVWDEQRIFDGEFLAQPHGPVNMEVRERVWQEFKTDWMDFDDENIRAITLTADERDTIEKVVEFYGSKKTQWLTNLIKQEIPYQLARFEIEPGKPGRVISEVDMVEYYGSL